jgi:hypothetical protein
VIATQLGALGCTNSELLHDERLVVLGAREALASFMKLGRPDAILLTRPSAHSCALYPAVDGRSASTGRWLTSSRPRACTRKRDSSKNSGTDWQSAFVLPAGTISSNFGNPGTGEGLRSICQLHSRVQCASSDTLGSFLLHTHVGGAIHAFRI